jgi:hypothetical protein
MKDLYARLGVDADATERELADALRKNSGMGQYASILLHDQKRAVYDQAHKVVTTIGTLRHRLGLDKEESWFRRNNPDFCPAARAIRSANPAVAAAPAEQPVSESSGSAHAPSTQMPTRQRRSGLIALLAAAVIVVVLYLVLK